MFKFTGPEPEGTMTGTLWKGFNLMKDSFNYSSRSKSISSYLKGTLSSSKAKRALIA